MTLPITAIVITSPIPSHPSTAIIHETLQSIRYHLPDCELLVLADGVREEEMDCRPDYMEFLSKLASDELFGYGKAMLLASFEHRHQVGLMRRFFDHIRSPLLLFMEHDTPLTTDPIPWQNLCDVLLNTGVDYVRFNPEVQIHPEHMHLMLDKIYPYGVPLMRTIQFHARPHLATKRFYERLLGKFTPGANCFIEDYAHSVCQVEGWDAWPLTIYAPDGNQKRSRHTNGREGSQKFDDRQVF
jgi:hypothetical protein